MNNDFFKDKVAVVTGGSGALCGCFCRALARNGAKVAVIGSRMESASVIANQIINEGGQAIAVACDVKSLDSVIAAEEQIFNNLGQYHILINGAGTASADACTLKEQADEMSVNASWTEEKTLFNMPTDNFDNVMKLNCTGIFNVTKVFSRKMANVPGANILNISSMSGFSPLTKQVAYSASKSAVSNLTQWLAMYLAGVNIRVNAIAPGFFLTPINTHLLKNDDGTYSPRAQKIVNGTPMKRFGKPEELVEAMLYLCNSNKSSFVTGVVLPVDGGFSAYSGV